MPTTKFLARYYTGSAAIKLINMISATMGLEFSEAGRKYKIKQMVTLQKPP